MDLEQALVSLNGSGLIFQLDFFSDFAPLILNLPNLLLKEVLRAQELKRKLSAILSADVKGYSRLMGEDEAGTVRTIYQYKKIRPDLIRQHRGCTAGSPKAYLPTEAQARLKLCRPGKERAFLKPRINID